MAILNVGPHSTYPTIAAAMVAAHPGDEISLEPGYRNEHAVVTENNLSMTGTASSVGIDLQLGSGVNVLTLLGDAPIHVHDNSGNNTITGNAGANTIFVSSGVDVVHGGLGNDRLIVNYAGDTSDIIGTSVHVTDGGTHSVTFDGIENFTITTGSGNDTITTGNGYNIISIGAGDDTITSGNGHNSITAGLGNDTITAGDGGNTIAGDAGNDTMTSGNGNDLLYGGAGNDTMTGGGGNDRLDGSTGNDTISGGAGNDILIGGTGNNIMRGGTGIDTADYSASTMAVNVHLASVVIQAVNTIESDTLSSIENVTGSRFNDTLTGTTGNNVLTGGLGADHMNGAGGADRFHYASARDSTSTKYDVITGFNTSDDKFDLWFKVTAIDHAVTAGHLSTATFDTDLTSVLNANHLGPHAAVLFTANSGTLAGDTFMVVDANGVAGYQAGHDLVIELAGATHLSGLSTTDFV
ncbi:MAG TPA: calcium-binding protein [Rhizomicrobium sp.]|nr:calcium-binding protein [Rhizomicrobium sp.]